MVSKAYACLAVVFLVLGIIGVFLPIMPTTPFVLVAAWAASKGSPRLHAWLYNHRHLGPVLEAWHARGAVPRRAKWLACSMMVLSWITLSVAGMPWWFLCLMAAIFIAVSVFLFTRPDA